MLPMIGAAAYYEFQKGFRSDFSLNAVPNLKLGERKMGEAGERNGAVVLAAGRGSRMKSSVHKQYLEIGGRPVLYYSLKQFEDCPQVDEIVLVTGEQEIEYCRREIVERWGLKK